MLRAGTLSLLLVGCVHNGQVEIAAPGVVGGVLVVGGMASAVGSCVAAEGSSLGDTCDRRESGDPVLATTLVISGVALLGLAYLFDRAR